MEGKFEHVNFSSASGRVAASFRQHGFSFGSQRGRHDGDGRWDTWFQHGAGVAVVWGGWTPQCPRLCGDVSLSWGRVAGGGYEMISGLKGVTARCQGRGFWWSLCGSQTAANKASAVLTEVFPEPCFFVII